MGLIGSASMWALGADPSLSSREPTRFLRFPKAESLGDVFVIKGDKREWCGEAKGLVKVPPDERLLLKLGRTMRPGIRELQAGALREVRSFDASNTAFSDWYARIFQTMPNVEEVDLSHTGVTDKTVESLQSLY